MRKRVLSLLVLTLCVFSAGGCRYLLPEEEVMLPPPLVKPVDITYQTVAVQRGNLEKSVQYTGRFISTMQETLSYQSTGRIETISATFGQEVKAGDVLCTLNTGELSYDIQRADYQKQQAELRYKKIRSMGAGKYELQSAELDLKIAQLNYDELVKRQEQATLKASIDGVVSFVCSEKVGDSIDAYVPVVTIIDPKNLMLGFEDTGNKSNFRVGMETEVTVNNQTYPGKVVSTPADRPEDIQGVSETSIVVQVDQSVLNQAELGNSALVNAVLDTRTNVLIIPANAVKTYQARKYVQVLKDGLKVEKDVEIGLETPTQVEVVKGLDEGELVIIE